MRNDECKITVTVGKTVQERQYEPFHITLSAEEICLKSKREEETKLLFENLEEQLHDLMSERLDN